MNTLEACREKIEKKLRFITTLPCDAPGWSYSCKIILADQRFAFGTDIVDCEIKFTGMISASTKIQFPFHIFNRENEDFFDLTLLGMKEKVLSIIYNECKSKASEK